MRTLRKNEGANGRVARVVAAAQGSRRGAVKCARGRLEAVDASGAQTWAGEGVAGEALMRYSIDNSSFGGGACATGRGGGEGSRPRLRSMSCAARRPVTMAMTLRFPPQGHSHTSTPHVLVWREAQSSLGRCFAFGGRPRVRAGHLMKVGMLGRSGSEVGGSGDRRAW